MVIQARQEDLPMSDQFWLTKAQLKRIEPFFPRTRGIPRVFSISKAVDVPQFTEGFGASGLWPVGLSQAEPVVSALWASIHLRKMKSTCRFRKHHPSSGGF